MHTSLVVIQLLVALSIFNVWVLRFGRESSWRGGEAKSMREEFAVYGLPDWSLILVGGLKLLCASLLLAGIWLPALSMPAAIGLAFLMFGAIGMHIKVGDPLSKAFPASFVFALCLVVGAGHM